MATEKPSFRPIAEFPPEIWENFLISFTFDDSVYESNAKDLDTLKGEVRHKLEDSQNHMIDCITLIDTLRRLGVSYHFQTEIDDKLNGMLGVHGLDGIATILEGYDLLTVALVFQAFRHYGHKLSSDVFKQFKNKDGKFDEALLDDKRGMLCLYEAGQWATHGEEILDEALEFIKNHIGSLTTHASLKLTKRTEDYFLPPCHKNMPKIEARQYITYYENKHDVHDDSLLKFAKLDFSLCQLLFRQELKNIMRWFKDSNLNKLSYGRVRFVEAFFWSIGICYEPHYTKARSMMTKLGIIITFIDDTYDAYGTIDELNLFTDAIQMYPDNKIELPYYMKILYEAIKNFFDEAEWELEKEGRLQCVSYAIALFKRLVKAYHQESMWLSTGCILTVEEYTENGRTSIAMSVIMVAAFMGMGYDAKLDVFEWLNLRPPISKAMETIGRLLNDIASHGLEQQRKHVPSVVECYIKQYGKSETDAIVEIKNWIREAWKDTNEELLKPNSISHNILIRFLYTSVTLDVLYSDNSDGFTTPERLKSAIVSMLFEDISLEN